MKAVREAFKAFFSTRENGKTTLRKKAVASTIVGMVSFVVVVTTLPEQDKNNAVLQHSPTKLVGNGTPEKPPRKPKTEHTQALSPVGETYETARQTPPRKPMQRRPSPPLNYRAKQVLSRDDPTEEGRRLPTGTNLIGQTLTPIDTRETGRTIKVLLPYGGSFKGENILPKNTVLLGKVRYGGQGSRVSVDFERAIFPAGLEVAVNAHALNPKDYSTGIEGDHHGTTGTRVATTLGLSVVSGMTDVLTSREVLGQYGTATPKSTMKNAILQGTSRAADMEASRQAREAERGKDYVTVAAGADVIVSLVSPFRLQEAKR